MKDDRLVDCLISCGREFQTEGAAWEKHLSPEKRLLLAGGSLSVFVSEDERVLTDVVTTLRGIMSAM